MSNHSVHNVYINDKLLRFLPVYGKESYVSEKGEEIISEASVDIHALNKKIQKEDALKGVLYLCDNPDETWKLFVSMFTLVEAAGGLVSNEKDELLLIFRKGKWDFPKGKIDYDESPEEAAVREVKEECGLEFLELTQPFMKLFHTYSHKNKNVLKKTHWFLMESKSDEVLYPQKEEDIEKAVWMNETQIRQEVFTNTYTSILNLLKNYFRK